MNIKTTVLDVVIARSFLCICVGLAYSVMRPALPILPAMTWAQAACAYFIITEIIGAVKS